MADVRSLLPRNGTAFLRALEQASAYDPKLQPGIDLIPDIKGRRLPAFLQFLLYEYGLIELTPYVPNIYDLLDQGRQWQIERDTFAAIARGLGWVGHTATISEAPIRRLWWNSFQLYLGALPASDRPDLDRIDRITQLSKPFRSDFRRGVFGYDVPPLETDNARADGSLLEMESGVRLRAGGPLWSFGRSYEYGHTLTEDEGEALGNYLVPTGEQSVLLNFLTNVAMIGDTFVDFEDAFSYTRPGPATAVNAAGAVFDFAADAMPLTNIGLTYDVASRNEIVSSSDPEALVFAEEINGLTTEIVDTGTTGGVGWADVRIHGFTTQQTGHFIEFGSIAVGTTGTWTLSAYLAIVAGSTAGLEGVTLLGLDISALGSTLTRVQVADAVAGTITPGIQVSYGVAAAIDITIRIGERQVEKLATASSLIRTSGAAANRQAPAGVVHLPAGLHNLTVVFDNNSEQVFEGLVGDFTLPAETLERRVIKEIRAIQLDGFESLRWIDLEFPWGEAGFPWVSPAGNARRIFLASWFEGREGYLALKAANGNVIGYRLIRAARQITPNSQGPYSFANVRYAPSPTGENVILEAMTGAGDHPEERTVAKVAWVFHATRVPNVPPGRLWLRANQLTGGVEIAEFPLTIPLRATVRERVKLLLRF